MSSNQVVMEAEHANTLVAANGQSWQFVTATGGTGGPTNNALQALPKLGSNVVPGSTSPRMKFSINVPTGSASAFYVHVYGKGATTSNDSVNVSINDSTTTFQTVTPLSSTGSFGWQHTAGTLTIPVGAQTITVWMREDGATIDRLAVNTTATEPTGSGPAESPRL